MATADRGTVLAVTYLAPGIATYFDVINYDTPNISGTMACSGCLVLQDIIAPTAGTEYGLYPGA